MGVIRTPREKWIEQGLRTLVTDGPDGVRIEILARGLGVTKGGFYGYFAGRDALLEAMLDTWEREATDQVLEQIDAEGGDARAKARRAGQLTFSSDRILPIDLAIRDWARRDTNVAERLRRVDNKRMQLLREVISTLCPDPLEVEARCLLAFSAAIAAHSIAADHPAHTRDQVITRAGDLLLTPSS
ncbi:TetR/AcrR family transcriptional regulator [Nonomuraea endophytica]|uniref:TetR/AcrR family transcriptional regulator n=1 Tax=Nonomuraea endophytica TaxID=714136 RepID=UPI0037CAC201